MCYTGSKTVLNTVAFSLHQNHILLVYHTFRSATDVKMYRIELHKRVKQLFELFYHLGIWNRGDQATVKEKRIKFFYSIYYFLFPISLVAGAAKSNSSDEFVFLLESAVMVAVGSIKLYYIIWKQKGFTELCHRISSYSFGNLEEFTLVNRKVDSFATYAVFYFFSCVIIASAASGVVPFVGSENKLFFNVGFPMDYKNNEIAYWVAFLFLLTEILLSALIVSFSLMTWFLLFQCSVKYQVLGNQLLLLINFCQFLHLYFL